jgi:hypothetical protein
MLKTTRLDLRMPAFGYDALMSIAPISAGHNVEPGLILRSRGLDAFVASAVRQIAFDRARADNNHYNPVSYEFPKIGRRRIGAPSAAAILQLAALIGCSTSFLQQPDNN